MILAVEFPLETEATYAMAAEPSDDPDRFLHEQLAEASPDNGDATPPRPT